MNYCEYVCEEIAVRVVCEECNFWVLSLLLILVLHGTLQ